MAQILPPSKAHDMQIYTFENELLPPWPNPDSTLATSPGIT